MRDIRSHIARFQSTGETFALATVVDTSSSAPREPGAAMAVSASGEAVGSVSGGCVEGAVYELAREAMATGEPIRQTYGISDDDAFSVGLTCGGTIHILVEALDSRRFPHLSEVIDDIDADRPVAVAMLAGGMGQLAARRVIWPDHAEGGLGSARLDAAVDDDARGMLAQGRTGILRYGAEGQRRGDDTEVFVQSFAPAPRMLVFGAIDFAAAVAEVGAFLGYRVTVCDARPVFATSTRFPRAHEVVVKWPHVFLGEIEEQIDERTVVCVLTHDPKFDVPVLEVALRTRAGYIGAMGSRRTHEDRLARLRDVGVPEEHLSRLRSPIGLDLGARTPEETAVSIAAELIQSRWQGSGRPLHATQGRIHREPEREPAR